MRVKVPDNIVGGSLMGAHTWVKSALVRINPGASTSNYKIQAIDGTPITLSDLTARKYREVHIIAGARKNPHHGGGYPVVQPDFEYPSYQSRGIVGNDLAKLLPKDIDGGMLERLSAEVGTFSALNTITRLMYTNETQSATDPQVAAMLQTYANASRQLGPRKNPGRPFFASDINDRYRGILSPEAAVRSFAEENLDMTFPEDSEDAARLVDRARIVDMYGLNQQDVYRFIDGVLTPFLAVSTANANLVKAMRHQDIQNYVIRSVLGRGHAHSDTASPYDSQLFAKFLALTPMRAEQFYDGIDYALIAHPAFARESLALAACNQVFITGIFNIVRDHPGNAGDAMTSNRIAGVGTRISFIEYLRSLVEPESEILWEMAVAQAEILEDTDPEVTIRAMQAIYDTTTRDEDLATFIQGMRLERLVAYVRDVAGFRPTAPPYWPKPVVLALMDTVKDNWNIVSQGLEISSTFLGLGYSGRVDEPETVEVVFRATRGGRIPRQERPVVQRTANLTAVRNLRAALQDITPEGLQRLIDAEADQFDNPITNNALDDYGNARRVPDATFGDIEDYVGNDEDAAELYLANNDNLAKLAFMVVAQTKNNDYFDRVETDEWNEGSRRTRPWAEYMGRDETPESILEEVLNEFRVALSQAIYVAEADNSRTVEQSPRAVSILSLFMEIEERARSQYNYNMTENDRAFALFLMEQVFDSLREMTPGDAGRIEDDGARDPGELLRILEGYSQRGDDTLGGEELSNRMQFEAYVVGIEQAWMDMIEAGDAPDDGAVTDWFQDVIDSRNWPPFAVNRLRRAATRIINYYPGELAGRWEGFE